MKIHRTMVSCLAVFGSLVMLAAASGTPAAAAEKAGSVVLVRGKVQIERPSGTITARARASLQESDSVATRNRSRVKMLFRDDSILTLGSNSRLVIRRYLYDPRNKRAESLYELADGRLRSVVGGPGFKVRTPTAFAAARGTVFTVQYDAKSSTTMISVAEGSVEVRNVNTEIPGMQVVTAGQLTTVSAGAPPTPPVPIIGSDKGPDEDGGGLPPVTGIAGAEKGLLYELRGKMGRGRLIPPIEQEPAQGASNVNLDVQFR